MGPPSPPSLALGCQCTLRGERQVTHLGPQAHAKGTALCHLVQVQLRPGREDCGSKGCGPAQASEQVSHCRVTHTISPSCPRLQASLPNDPMLQPHTMKRQTGVQSR